MEKQGKLRVLIVDDDPLLTAATKKFLSQRGIETKVANSFLDVVAMKGSVHCDFDLVILDVHLHDGNGIDLLKIFREKSEEVPVMMLSANTSELSKVTALNIGADDYVCKPFSLEELFCRINAILRRSGRARISAAAPPPEPMQAGVFEIKGLKMDIGARSVSVDGAAVRLRFIEFEILKILVANRNSVVKAETLIREVWNDERIDKKTVEPHISRVRKNLGPYGRCIETVPHVGYRFNAESAAISN